MSVCIRVEQEASIRLGAHSINHRESSDGGCAAVALLNARGLLRMTLRYLILVAR